MTAADERFSRCLYQLLRAAERTGWRELGTWIAYDLGMRPATAARLAERFKWSRFRSLDLAALPPHYAPDAGSYAWKPHIIASVAEEHEGPILWMDSATLPLRQPTEILDDIRDDGIYALRGQAALYEQCDRSVLERLDVPGRYWGSRMLAAGLIGFDTRRPDIHSIIRTWAKLAEDPLNIRPPDAKLRSHKNDQALLSCLILPELYAGRLKIKTRDVDISCPWPTRILSTRNKVPPSLPLVADPLARAYYASYKYINQRLLRLDPWFDDKRIVHRWRHEYFEVRWKREDETSVHRLPCPLGHYYADPFLWREAGRQWLFVEDFNYLKRRGVIAAVPLDDPEAGARTVLDPGCHASFPFLFRFDGQIYMTPETSANGGVDLYRCDAFPDRWTHVRRILDGVEAVDTVIMPHDGRWWLFTTAKSPDSGGSYRYLAVYHTDDPLAGEWIEHPVTRQGLYITMPKGSGRNAGNPVFFEGQVYRPMQNSRTYYGEGMLLNRITVLTPQDFAETPAEPPPAIAAVVAEEGVHHISWSGGLIAWDKRLRK